MKTEPSSNNLRRMGIPVGIRLIPTGRELPLPEDVHSFSIGTDPVNSIVLADPYVSAMHCLITRNGPNTLLIKDRKSRNGTYVNGTRVHECEAYVGSRLVAGMTSMVIVGSRADQHRLAAEELVGKDATFRAAVDMVVRAASLPASILCIGESGTGKELIARLVHEASARSSGPFVAVNCGAIAPSLVESELFGHEKGAFTGATEKRRGYFEQASSGTLFLDEVGELPIEQQPRLLRVLESRRFRRVGGHEEIECDVRIVAATHRDLRTATERGEFRRDLYHRLATVEVRMPPLRERPGDIPALAEKLLLDLIPELGPHYIEPDALAALMTHPWPGNARELRNALYRAALLTAGDLTSAAILGHVRPPAPPLVSEPGAPHITLDGVRREVLTSALETHGSVRKAAAAIGIPKSTFHDQARRHGLVDLRRGKP